MNEFIKFKIFILLVFCVVLLMSGVLLWKIRNIRLHLFWKVVLLLSATVLLWILWNVLIWGYNS
ncbi:hypothetical protein BU200_04335 [Streptococcus acidominimus]|uniref:Uncharacterized protein n=1 Tax=Streptococcus acidominimus TaxID=1326 RepID=A0A1Q8EDZ1_STRAI|nr:hypothetical protein BU200_04335 [Streptococcus acidominimus]SUN08520.1 Uncharacterised protein [Streptococcus acidominimus]